MYYVESLYTVRDPITRFGIRYLKFRHATIYWTIQYPDLKIRLFPIAGSQMPLQFSWVPSVWDALQGFHPVALLQWWGTGKSAGQVLAVHQLCPSGRSASLITGHRQLQERWRRTSCSTPDSFCTTTTEYWAKTWAQLFFQTPCCSIFLYFACFLLGWFVGFFCSLYATRSSYAFCYNYWLTWANKTCWSGLRFIPAGISATFPVFFTIFHPTLCC